MASSTLTLMEVDTPQELQVQETLIQKLTEARKRKFEIEKLEKLWTDDKGLQEKKRKLDIELNYYAMNIQCLPKNGAFDLTKLVYGRLAWVFPTWVYLFPANSGAKAHAKVVVTYTGQNLEPGQPLVLKHAELYVRGRPRNIWVKADPKTIEAEPIVQLDDPIFGERGIGADESRSHQRHEAAQFVLSLLQNGSVPNKARDRLKVTLCQTASYQGKTKGNSLRVALVREPETKEQKAKVDLPLEFQFGPLARDLNYNFTFDEIEQIRFLWNYAFDPTYTRLFGRKHILGRLGGLDDLRFKIVEFLIDDVRLEPGRKVRPSQAQRRNGPGRPRARARRAPPGVQSPAVVLVSRMEDAAVGPFRQLMAHLQRPDLQVVDSDTEEQRWIDDTVAEPPTTAVMAGLTRDSDSDSETTDGGSVMEVHTPSGGVVEIPAPSARQRSSGSSTGSPMPSTIVGLSHTELMSQAAQQLQHNLSTPFYGIKASLTELRRNEQLARYLYLQLRAQREQTGAMALPMPQVFAPFRPLTGSSTDVLPWPFRGDSPSA